MLALSRKAGQGFWVGAAHVIVSEIRGNKVRLAIDAPKAYVISRDELLTGEPVATASTLDEIRREVESIIATADDELSRLSRCSDSASQYYRGQRIAAKRILAILERE